MSQKARYMKSSKVSKHPIKVVSLHCVTLLINIFKAITIITMIMQELHSTIQADLRKE